MSSKNLTNILKNSIPLVCYLCCTILFFSSRQWGDTYYYASDILNSKSFLDPKLWEFGHLLWRPWGYLSHKFLLLTFSVENSNLQIIKTLSYISWIHGLILVYAFYKILLLLDFKRNSAAFACILLTLYYPFLDYSLSGTPYIAGLCWLLLGAFNDLKKQSRFYLTAICFVVSVLLWTPYVFSLPAYTLFYKIKSPNKFVIRSRDVLLTLIFLAILFSAWALASKPHQIESQEQFLTWVTSADHGKIGHGGLQRTIYGFANSYFDLADYGKEIKRVMLQHDYSFSALSSLINVNLFYLLFFYLYLFFLLILLTKKSKHFFILFSLNLVINLAFAVYFDGGSTERYLSIFPFFIIGVLYVFKNEAYSFKVFSTVFFTLLVCNTAFNNSKIVLENDNQKVVQRFDGVVDKVKKEDLILVLNLSDPLASRVKGFLYSWNERIIEAVILPVADVGNASSANWKEQITTRISDAKERGQQVWLSKRLLKEVPLTTWGWVEGEDSKLSYTSIGQFFNSFKISTQNDDIDGFVLIE